MQQSCCDCKFNTINIGNAVNLTLVLAKYTPDFSIVVAYLLTEKKEEKERKKGKKGKCI